MHEYWVIAPSHPDLTGVADEAAAIAESLGAKLTQGDVTLATLLGYVDSRRRRGGIVPLRGVWLATHMADGAAWLSQGDTIDAEQIAALLLTLGDPWLVLNTCDSEEAVHRIQAHAPVDVVYTIADTPDRRAWYFARMVAQNFDRYNDLRAAVYAASPGGTSLYRFLPAPSSVSMPNRYVENDEDREPLRGAVRELQDTVYGDQRRRMVGIVDQIRRVNWWLLAITILLLLNLAIQVVQWLSVAS